MADFEVPDLDNSETDPSCPHRPQPQRRRDGSVFDCQSARNVATRVGPLSMIKGWRHGVRSRSLVGTPGTRFRSTGACFGSAGTCFEDRAGERSLLSQGQFSRKPRRRRDDDYPRKKERSFDRPSFAAFTSRSVQSPVPSRGRGCAIRSVA